MPAKINKETVKKELKRLGLKKGAVVFVHSAFSAVGKVEGGPDAVIDAIIETVGPKGTVAMTRLGGALLSRIFAERKETVEGTHPTHLPPFTTPKWHKQGNGRIWCLIS